MSIYHETSFRQIVLTGLAALISLSGSVLAQNCPVVDFGDDLSWFAVGGLFYRDGQPNYKLTSEKLEGPNYRLGHPFSLEMPLNPVSSAYNIRGNNTRFYGGMLTLAYNTPDAKFHWTEGGVNIDHDGFDDLNYMGYALKSPENKIRAFGVWLWKKADFLNCGDRYPVTFDDASRVGVFLSRTYPVDKFNDSYANTRIQDLPRNLWRGWEAIHLIVQDGAQFYIAEPAFKPQQWTLYEVSPTKVKWAKYNPQPPWDFEWDHARAKFDDHTFTDVQAVGWMIAKPTAELAGLWLKWYGFGMDAVVNRPWSPGWNLPLKKLEDTTGRDGLYMAKTEVSYAQWIKIYKWASRNQYGLHPGYNFDQDGNVGSMILDSAPHASTEPVTGITWQDAALWCNALSEYEGRTPCYYVDAACTKVLRAVKDRSSLQASLKPPSFYWKTTADGYRLPTPAEWVSAATLGKEPNPWVGSASGGKTRPITAGEGFSDLIGNVWEYVWDPASPEYDPAKSALHTVLGGDFRYPANFAVSSGLPYGEIPSRGHYAIGFRPVRREGPPRAPELTGIAAKPGLWEFDKFPAWSFAEEQRIPPAGKTEPAAPPMDLITVENLLAGKTEVTWAQWKAVFNWAEMNGYCFDHDGDMGSSKWDDQAAASHAPDEPVTSISILDAMVWCNALSEMSRLKPCYYEDQELKSPLRSVNPTRISALPDRQTTWQPKKLVDVFSRAFFVDEKATSYRLPTSEEWTLLAGTDLYPSGSVLVSDRAWYLENSGHTTHPVAQTKPTGEGFFDLAGNVFEWVIATKKEGVNLEAARGGSFRSDNLLANSPLKNKIVATNTSFGGGMNIGVANAEIGFRVIRNAK